MSHRFAQLVGVGALILATLAPALTIAQEVGTQENPAPIREEFQVSRELTVAVREYNPAATELVMAATGKP